MLTSYVSLVQGDITHTTYCDILCIVIDKYDIPHYTEQPVLPMQRKLVKKMCIGEYEITSAFKLCSYTQIPEVWKAWSGVPLGYTCSIGLLTDLSLERPKEILIRRQTPTFLQIFCEPQLHFQIIFKSMRVSDDTQWHNFGCELVNSFISGEYFRRTFGRVSKTMQCLDKQLTPAAPQIAY